MSPELQVWLEARLGYLGKPHIVTKKNIAEFKIIHYL